jgi:decaprenylphospho-beta-D-ribofuranose 2-oxidase
MKGYSLALDLPVSKSVFQLLDRLDGIVENLGGRVYLSKDARLSRRSFDKTYGSVDLLRKYRLKNEMLKLNSVQSQRLEL